MALPTLTIYANALKADYRGCGKAWTAVVNGEVVAIRYMDPPLDRSALPAWIRAVKDNAEGLDYRMLPTAWSSRGLSKLAAAASGAGDCPVKPKGGNYRPKELLTMARAAIMAWDSASFAAHRERCRAELAAIGEVVSGTCSCTEFCPGY